MIVPQPPYRPNPARAIFVNGEINPELLALLTPQLLRLLSESREPITVYIVDSPGGSVASMESILGLLNLSDQDFSPPCQIITVVTERAASAAADLLASGDYSIALPDSTILYHGVRTPLRTATAEQTSMLAHFLRLRNDHYAMELARKIEFRFTFRFAQLRTEFDEFRGARGNPSLPDMECFLSLISGKLSPEANKAFTRAASRYQRYMALLAFVTKKVKTSRAHQSSAKLEADRLKAIIDFEVSKNRRDDTWTFKDGGIARVADDFFILNEYLDTHVTSDRLLTFCKRYARFFLTTEVMEEINAREGEAKQADALLEHVRPILQPLWSFFVAFCHAIQEGENELTASDAYWLGLVDEVWGDESLHAFRLIAEYEPDSAPISDRE